MRHEKQRDNASEDRRRLGRWLGLRLGMRAVLAVGILIAASAPGPSGLSASDTSSFSCSASAACGGSAACEQPRPSDEVWMVSTRGLCRPAFSDRTGPRLQVSKYERGEGWRSAELEEFLSESPHRPTVIYAHGNRVECWEAAQAGWDFYSALLRDAPSAPGIRYVVWSWPSDQEPGVVRDVRTKAIRAEWDAVYFGWFLAQLDPQTPLGLIGYSYGARIVTGGLHLLAGGALLGRRLPSASVDPTRRRRCRVALLAAAVDNGWLSPGAPHGMAPKEIDRLLLLNNSQDFVLRRYCILDRRCRPEALGFTGLCDESAFDAEGGRVEQWDVAGVVGRSHHVSRYLASPILMDRVRQCLLEGLRLESRDRGGA